MAAKGPEEKYLVCFDFDETISQGHFHGYLAGTTAPYGKKRIRRAEPGEATPELIAECIQTLGLRNPELTAATIKSVMAHGHKVAVTSYTLYPEVVAPTFRTMGLSEAEISQIAIIGGFPDVDGHLDLTGTKGLHAEHGKQPHIIEAKNILSAVDYKVILIDDSVGNIKKAKQDSHIGIEAPKGGRSEEYLLELLGYVDQSLCDTLKYNKAVTEIILSALDEVRPEYHSGDYNSDSESSDIGNVSQIQSEADKAKEQELEAILNACNQKNKITQINIDQIYSDLGTSVPLKVFLKKEISAINIEPISKSKMKF
jgi:hypothetical protein